jgi:hypothetical protein
LNPYTSIGTRKDFLLSLALMGSSSCRIKNFKV